jgi:2-polyprenyl-3-methyl-5-hydroxy-6-metoxy-1,4-benzoquinol methylase
MKDTIFANKAALVAALVRPEDRVLDVGFWGQGVSAKDANWPHRLLLDRAREVWGLDLDYDDAALPQGASRYRRASAESFDLGGEKFDLIFAGDLIEHLPNPGLFLGASAAHLAPNGRLVITTPSAFNLFNLLEKVSKREPTTNPDHTCYFNQKTLRQLFAKCGWRVDEVRFVYTLGVKHRESWKKKAQNLLYRALSHFTDKFDETVVVVATPIRK